MSPHCHRHAVEPAVVECHDCRRPCCKRCLVIDAATGARMCLPCVLAVRNTEAVASRRGERRRRRALAREGRAVMRTF